MDYRIKDDLLKEEMERANFGAIKDDEYRLKVELKNVISFANELVSKATTAEFNKFF